jgi:hypothetical protein
VTPRLSGDLVFRRSDGWRGEASLEAAGRGRAGVPVNEAGGHAERAPTGLSGW